MNKFEINDCAILKVDFDFYGRCFKKNTVCRVLEIYPSEIYEPKLHIEDMDGFKCVIPVCYLETMQEHIDRDNNI